MLRIILVTTFIVVNADSTINNYSPSSSGFKSYEFGNGHQDKYSKGSSKYYISGASPGNINSALSSSYPSSSSYSDENQGESLPSSYENLENSYSSESQNAGTLPGYLRDRAYLPNTEYTSSSLSSQSDYPGTSNSQPEISGRPDYEGSLKDYTGSATQQYTVGSSYKGSSLENYPGSQEPTSVRGSVAATQGSSPASGFVASPSYSDTHSNRAVYNGNGFKALDVSGFRGYNPGSNTREFVGSGKHRGQVASFSSKYPVYESSSSDGYSGNEVEYMPSFTSPHVYSTANNKRESYNSVGGAPHGAYSTSSGFNFLPATTKGSYSVTGMKGHPSAYPGGPRETGSIPVHFSGSSVQGSEGTRYIISGGSPSYAPYSSNPSMSLKGHGSAYLSGGFGGSGGPGKIIIIKDSPSGSPHSSSSSYPGGHMYSSAPSIGGSFKMTRGTSLGNQGASYIPSFAGGSSPSHSSRFTTGGYGGGNSFAPYMTAS